MMDLQAYHLCELSVAKDPNDPRHILPPIGAGHRRILDVGCGAGQTLIASQLPSDIEAVGIDVSPVALSLGRKLDASLHLVCARGEALPFPNGHFDLVISRVTVPYMRVDAALAEMCRVATDNGTIWLTLHSFSLVATTLLRDLSRFDIPRAMYRLYVMANGMTGHMLNREFACPFSGGRLESFQTRRRVTRCLTRLGCVDIDVEVDPFFVVTATKRAATKPVPRLAAAV